MSKNENKCNVSFNGSIGPTTQFFIFLRSIGAHGTDGSTLLYSAGISYNGIDTAYTKIFGLSNYEAITALAVVSATNSIEITLESKFYRVFCFCLFG